MANLDSRSKRASSVGILLSFILALVLPDGTIAQADRQHIAWSYSGIEAGGRADLDYPTNVTIEAYRTKATMATHKTSASMATHKTKAEVDY